MKTAPHRVCQRVGTVTRHNKPPQGLKMQIESPVPCSLFWHRVAASQRVVGGDVVVADPVVGKL